MFRVDTMMNLNASRKRKRAEKMRKKYQPQLKKWKVTPHYYVGQPAVADIILRLNDHSSHIVEHIFSYLDYESVINAEKVSLDWQDILKNESIWKALIKRNVARDPIWRTIFNQVKRSVPHPSGAADDVYMSRRICQEVGNLKLQFIALMSSSVSLLSSSVALISKVLDMFKLIGFGDRDSDDSDDD